MAKKESRCFDLTPFFLHSGKVEEKTSAVKKAAAAPKKPAKCELNGTKWNVEWQFNPSEPVVIKSTGKNQTVYIYKVTSLSLLLLFVSSRCLKVRECCHHYRGQDQQHCYRRLQKVRCGV